MKLAGSVGGHPAVVLIDCGATGNFISSSFVTEKKLATESLPQQEEITLADGSKQKAASIVKAAKIAIGSYTDQFDLVSLPLSGYDVILGMSWLYEYNVAVDWREKKVSFVDDAKKRHTLRGASARSVRRKVNKQIGSNFKDMRTLPDSELLTISARQLRKKVKLSLKEKEASSSSKSK